ncbi:helix-turn-helix transcriptional regulator [Piscinibacter aquaticus]|uniref:Helix-turn-helix transcriptional regulator n=1 Tax=Piscinibacter aquaticus TaxID=392597 RepID=A0A5C6U376_9BURK|nr:helix-turn-helix transcriptional regulator [Piscinibacter aquaticus]
MSDLGNPDLLRVARQWRGLQQGDAAQRLGVSRAMLSRIENRLSGFTGDLIDRAAAVFDMPRTFFIQTDTVLGAPVSVHPMWRKKAAVSAREMDQIVAELNLRLMHMRRLLRAVEIEATYPIPALPVDEFESVERIAALARAMADAGRAGAEPDALARSGRHRRRALRHGRLGRGRGDVLGAGIAAADRAERQSAGRPHALYAGARTRAPGHAPHPANPADGRAGERVCQLLPHADPGHQTVLRTPH